MEPFLVTLYIAIWFWLIQRRKRMEGFYSLNLLFGLCGMTYFIVIPLELYFGENEFVFVHHWLRLGAGERGVILLMSIFSLIGFQLGLSLSRYRFIPEKGKTDRPPGRLGRHSFDLPLCILIGITLVGGISLFLYYHDLLLQQWDYAAAYTITYQSPLYSFVKLHFLIAMCLLASVIMHRDWPWKAAISLTMVIFVALFGVMTADKEPLLLVFLTVASLLDFSKASLSRFTITSIAGVVGVATVVVFFNVYRTRLPLKEVLYVTESNPLSFTKLDPVGPMVSLVSVLSDASEFRYGETYICSLGVLVPKAIWPGRPLDLSEKFARENIADWREGRGFGYSPLAEAYSNFGATGAVVHFVIFGLLMGGFLRAAGKLCLNRSKDFLAAFIHIVGFYILIMSFRSALIGPIKMMMMVSLPYLLLLMMGRSLGKLARGRRRRTESWRKMRGRRHESALDA